MGVNELCMKCSQHMYFLIVDLCTKEQRRLIEHDCLILKSHLLVSSQLEFLSDVRNYNLIENVIHFIER